MNTNSSQRMLRDDASAQAQFIEPTPSGRRKIATIIVGGIVSSLVIKLWLSPAYFGHIRGLPVCDQLPWLRNTLIVGMLFPLAIALVWAIPTALKMLKFGQSPLPGTVVFVRTQIKRGSTVRWRAYGLLAWSLLALVLPFWGWHLLAHTPFFSPPLKCMAGSVHAGQPSPGGNGHAR